MEIDEADRRTEQSLLAVGLPKDHEARYGALAGVALETALRNWALGLGWVYPEDSQSLDKVVNWLIQHKHVTNDEAARLKMDTRIRNHCAHGRWYFLERGQVDHLIQSAESWIEKLQAMGVNTTTIKSYSKDVALEQVERTLTLRRWVSWAFTEQQLRLKTPKEFLLGLFLLMTPIMIFALGAIGALESIPLLVDVASRTVGTTLLTAAFLPILWIALMFIVTVGVGLGLLHAGIMRLNGATETALAAASWIWVKKRSRRELLMVRRVDGARTLVIVEYRGECSGCGAELQFVQASNRGDSSVYARCPDFSSEHRFRVDPSTMIARSIS